MFNNQTIEQPFGISVFGSSVVRLEPDIASLAFAVSRLAKDPKSAFREARDSAKSVRDFLAQLKVKDVSSSRVTLSQTSRFIDGEPRFVGYTAKVAFHVILRDLDIIESVLSGVVEAGANELDDVSFQTSRLKELRADARRRAVEAAREKAENYCKAAGITLGPVIHIQDVNPESLRQRLSHQNVIEIPTDDAALVSAFDPGSITVGGAVVVAYEIGRP